MPFPETSSAEIKKRKAFFSEDLLLKEPSQITTNEGDSQETGPNRVLSGLRQILAGDQVEDSKIPADGIQSIAQLLAEHLSSSELDELRDRLNGESQVPKLLIAPGFSGTRKHFEVTADVQLPGSPEKSEAYFGDYKESREFTDKDYDQIVAGIQNGRFCSFQEYGFAFNRHDNAFLVRDIGYSWLNKEGVEIASALNIPPQHGFKDYGNDVVPEREWIMMVAVDDTASEEYMNGNKAVISGYANKSLIDNTKRVGATSFRLYFSSLDSAALFTQAIRQNPQEVLRKVFIRLLPDNLPTKSGEQVNLEKVATGITTGVTEPMDPFSISPEKWVVGVIEKFPGQQENGFGKMERTEYPTRATQQFIYDKSINGWNEVGAIK